MLPEDFNDWLPAEREAFLRENADTIEQDRVRKPLTQEELADAKDKLTEVSLKLRRKKNKYDEIKDHWRNEVIKPLKETVSQLLDKLENKGELVDGEIFFIRDQKNEMVYGFLEDGTQVRSRPMRHEEKQQTIHGANRNMKKIENDNS